MWQKATSAVANHTVKYTATNAYLDFEPNVTNADAADQNENLAKYNEFFIQNGGYQADPSYFYAEKGANTFKAFNLGVDWMMTSTVPVPASVFALMEDKDIVEGEVDYVGYQANVGSTLSSIRVITGLNSTEYANTGYELYLVKAGEDATFFDMNTKTVYSSLNVYDENENKLDENYSNPDYAYLSAIKVTGLDGLTGTTTLIVTPYVTVSGTKIYGSACAILIEKVEGVWTITDQYVM